MSMSPLVFSGPNRPHRQRLTRRLLNRVAPVCVALLLTSLLSACGGSDLPELSPQAAAGRSLAGQAGCAACHGRNGNGGVGPAWSGLAGSTRTLEDGTTVVADDAYLRRAIADPAVEIVDGYNLNMPPNNLDDDEIDLIVTYIKEVS